MRLLADTPLSRRDQDYFGYSAHADAVAEIIDSETTDTPLTIAITGAWGSGKTSVAHMVERRLTEWTILRRGERAMTICWFNAWLHDDAPHLGAALAAHVAEVANSKRRWWQRLLSPLPDALLSPGQRWHRRAGLLVGLLAITAIATIAAPTRDVARQLAFPKVAGGAGAAAGSLAVLAFGALILWRKLFAAAQDAARFVQTPEGEARFGALGRARDQLGRLIGQARRDGRYVIFVDDLERCRPPRAIVVCEVASQLLAHLGVVTVLLADMESVATSAELKYRELTDAQAGRRIGREYLEKMVQLQVTLPPPRHVDMVAMLTDRPPLLRTTSHERLRSALALRGSSSPRALGETGLSIASAAFAAISAAVATVVGRSIFGEGLGVLVLAAVVPIVVAGVAEIARAWRVQSGARRRERIDKRIRALASETEQSDLEARLLAETRDEDKALARKQLSSYLTDEANELHEVEAVIVEHPPVLPRSAKRMLNHARLLTRIARDRGLFDGEPRLAPAHLGKWIVICERWRDVAERVTLNGSLMKRLEAGADAGDISALLEAEGIHGGSSVELRSLLRGTPRLSDVIERLVRLEPGIASTSETPDVDHVPVAGQT